MQPPSARRGNTFVLQLAGFPGGQTIEIIATDPTNRTSVISNAGVTNANGTGLATFPTSEVSPNGTYRLQVRAGQTIVNVTINVT